MTVLSKKLSAVSQNLILGSITGFIVTISMILFFRPVGGTEVMCLFFLALGPVVGYFSGKERQRMERLRKEKTTLEENLNKIQSALERSTKKYRLLVEHASDAIFLTTLDGRLLLFNEATCLLSGYTRGELKKMSLVQLQAEEDVNGKHHKAWLDNGTCRYEEEWINKDKNLVLLEINARWIHFGEHRLILHVGRDILRQKETNHQEKARDIRKFQENKLIDMALAHHGLYSHIFTPLDKAIELIHYFRKEYPKESEKFSDVLLEWGSTRKLLQSLISKNLRDLNPTPSQWALNEILRQELYYLESIVDSNSFVARTSFASDLPVVYGFGKDFSSAFGAILTATLESMKTSDQREFSVSTQASDDHILVEIQSAKTVSFREHLSRITDPFFNGDDSNDHKRTKLGFLVCQMLFDSIGASIDLGDQEVNGTLIRIKIPVIQGKQDLKISTYVENSSDPIIV